MSKTKATRNTLTQPDNNDSQLLSVSDDNSIDKMETMFTRLTKLITESFAACIVKLTTIIEEKCDTKINAQAAEIFNLANKSDRLERKIHDLTAINNSLNDKILSITREMNQLITAQDNLKQYTRADSVLLHGFPLPQSGTTENLLTDIPTTLNRLIPNIHLTPENISVCHRLPSASTPSSGPATRPPPVVVRFTRRHTRTLLMQNRKALKGKPIVITDHLTPTRAALLKKASALVAAHKLSSCWSQDGKILVKSMQNRTVVIISDEDLAAFN